MAGGDAKREQLIRAVKRGVLITRFHYTNTPDPKRATMTGTTRDGTFLIEDGRITRGPCERPVHHERARPVRGHRPAGAAAARARLVVVQRDGLDRVPLPADEGVARDHHWLEPDLTLGRYSSRHGLVAKRMTGL